METTKSKKKIIKNLLNLWNDNNDACSTRHGILTDAEMDAIIIALYYMESTIDSDLSINKQEAT